VAVIDNGRVLDTGPPNQLVDRHAPWAVVRFDAGMTGVRPDSLEILPGVSRVCVTAPLWRCAATVT